MAVRVSRNGTLLPIPTQLEGDVRRLQQEWPDAARWPFRSRWLRELELMLALYYPSASAADLRLTARHAAPFYLLDGPNVP